MRCLVFPLRQCITSCHIRCCATMQGHFVMSRFRHRPPPHFFHKMSRRTPRRYKIRALICYANVDDSWPARLASLSDRTPRSFVGPRYLTRHLYSLRSRYTEYRWLNELIFCVDSGLAVEVGAEKASIPDVVRESKDFMRLTTVNEGVYHPHHQFNNHKIAMDEQDSPAVRVSVIIIIPDGMDEEEKMKMIFRRERQCHHLYR